MALRSFSDSISIRTSNVSFFGGPGSGHHQHGGRPGKKGGSSKGSFSGYDPKTGMTSKSTRKLLNNYSKILRSDRSEQGIYSKKEVERARRVLKKADDLGLSYSEANTQNPRVPMGDNYHCSVGWY